MSFININGEILASGQANISVGNRAFKYGDGLFESMRMMRGKLMFADLHAQRLREGMDVLHIDGAAIITQEFLEEKVRQLAIRNNIRDNARVRLTVFRDGDGLYSPVSNDIGYVIEMSRTDQQDYTANYKGLIAQVYEDMTKPINMLSNLKTCNSLLYVMAGIFRKKNSLDEVFILNQKGFLCEGMSTNLFVLYQQHLYTPSLEEGCIAGVMRSVVIRLAEDNGIEVIEAQINPDILNEADEVFVTNATTGIQWIMGFNGKRYFNKLSNEFLGYLNAIA
ncbi:branched-chain amino acid aminotransferase [Arcticibacter pallidicorallinus]|uniref:branched-chain-amino-acid transaminase n=1 Tax=Arcticibacter pallidicorallinus TaxID=1259464 RepID=A0A2T0U2X9_9SPHI|nr:aminotransferase class IV [Arcticibacter pallidicorallinus]PRY52277.1 branched-chain amino acid aminotransferase [Arcticibacter pallidicorallinus]